MPNRRDFLKNIAGASAGAFLLGRGANGLAQLSPQPVSGAKHAPVLIGRHRVKTLDVHCHITVPEATDLLRGTPLERAGEGGPAARYNIPLNAERLQKMDEMGIDVQAVSINAFWYSADRDLATRLIDLQNRKACRNGRRAESGSLCGLCLRGAAISRTRGPTTGRRH